MSTRRDFFIGSTLATTFGVPAVATLLAAMSSATAEAAAAGGDAGDLETELLRSRAVEAMIWGMPAVNYQLMFEQMQKAGGKANQIVYWSGLPDWKNQTLTPNPDSIYLMPFFTTKDGPVVIEIPPADGGSINGTIMDVWQMPLEDVGPAGVDQGKGGKYLILPAGYADTPPEGYIALPSKTRQGYALLRSILGNDQDNVAKAVAYGKQIKVYPLADAANPPGTILVDVLGQVFDATIPYDARFFETLYQVVQDEPWLTRDLLMIDQLKSLGIERGKPFAPDPAMTEVMNAAAKDTKALLEARYERTLAEPYFPGGHWGFPALPDYLKAAADGFSSTDDYPTDSRGLVFTYAFFTPKHVGQGQFYLMAIKDSDGNVLNGANTYRLTVPANVPVSLYWSATAYARDNHALIRDTPWSSRSSQSPGLKPNADGSVDITFGPTAPAGDNSNWVPTDATAEFEVLFRFYGPKPTLFDKSWVLPDIEKVS